MGRVLICDDAAAYGILFARWMRDCGFEVTHARTASDAMQFAEDLQPPVIVVDHLLPDGTSEQLVPQLRETVPGARVLLISGMPDDRLAETAKAVGADAYIGKASTADAMRKVVTELMG